jgi:hypothetical protein
MSEALTGLPVLWVHVSRLHVQQLHVSRLPVLGTAIFFGAAVFFGTAVSFWRCIGLELFEDMLVIDIAEMLQVTDFPPLPVQHLVRRLAFKSAGRTQGV